MSSIKGLNPPCEICCNLDVSAMCAAPAQGIGWFSLRLNGNGVDGRQLRTFESLYPLEESSEAGCYYCSLILGALPLPDWCRHSHSTNWAILFTLELDQQRPPSIVLPDESICIMYTVQRGPLRVVPALPALPALPAIKSNALDALDFVRQRLAECCSSHTKCSIVPVGTSRGPSATVRRLLKLDEAKRTVRLEERTQDCSAPFVALSYCWGGDQGLKLTAKTERLLSNGLSLQTLAPLHQDAVVVCWTLGVAYLWIDALCIRQDDEQDWAQQSADMAAIYGDAHFTIQASSCSSIKESLFSTRTDPAYGAFGRALRRSPSGTALVSARSKIMKGFHHPSDHPEPFDPLAQRAWAFQEAVLSRRIINFTSRETQWLCRASFSCECGDPMGREFENSMLYEGMKSLTNDEACELWRTYVQHYTRTDISRASDRLVAISSLAAKLSKYIRTQYLAGIWESDLIRELLWISHDRTTTRPSWPYRAPSFSWASIEGRVSFFSEDICLAPMISVISVNCRPSTTLNPFGEVVEGRLQLDGLACHCAVHFSDGGSLVSSDCPQWGGVTFVTQKTSWSTSGLCYIDCSLDEVILTGTADVWLTRLDFNTHLSRGNKATLADRMQHSNLSVALEAYRSTGRITLKLFCLRFAMTDHGQEYSLLLSPSRTQANCYERLGFMRCDQPTSENGLLDSKRFWDEVSRETITIV